MGDGGAGSCCAIASTTTGSSLSRRRRRRRLHLLLAALLGLLCLVLQVQQFVSLVDLDDLLFSSSSLAGSGTATAHQTATTAAADRRHAPRNDELVAPLLPAWLEEYLEFHARSVVVRNEDQDGGTWRSRSRATSPPQSAAPPASTGSSNGVLIYRCRGGGDGGSDSGHGPCGGLGDRLKGMLTAFYLAVLTRRVFLIDHTHPVPLTETVWPNRLQWNADAVDVDDFFEQHYSRNEYSEDEKNSSSATTAEQPFPHCRWRREESKNGGSMMVVACNPRNQRDWAPFRDPDLIAAGSAASGNNNTKMTMPVVVLTTGQWVGGYLWNSTAFERLRQQFNSNTTNSSNDDDDNPRLLMHWGFHVLFRFSDRLRRRVDRLRRRIGITNHHRETKHNNQQEAPPPPYTAVHIRTGGDGTSFQDPAIHTGEDAHRRFLACAQEFQRQQHSAPPRDIVVISDSVRAKRRIRSWTGNDGGDDGGGRVRVAPSRRIFHMDKTRRKRPLTREYWSVAGMNLETWAEFVVLMESECLVRSASGFSYVPSRVTVSDPVSGRRCGAKFDRCDPAIVAGAVATLQHPGQQQQGEHHHRSSNVTMAAFDEAFSAGLSPGEV